MDIKELIQFQKEYPDCMLVAETPDYSVRMRLGDILVYEGMRGEIVLTTNKMEV